MEMYENVYIYIYIYIYKNNNNNNRNGPYRAPSPV
jgi:hypothetical protein